MPLLVLFADLRNSEPQLTNVIIEFELGISALQVVQRSLGASRSERIEADLVQNDQTLMVSW